MRLQRKTAVTESEATAPAPKCLKRLYIFWGVALTLLVVIAVFCWLVVVPVWHVKVVVRGSAANDDLGDTVEELGGPSATYRKVALYRHTWFCSAEDEECLARLLGRCGPRAVPALVDMLEATDADIAKIERDGMRIKGRCDFAAESLAEIGAPAVPALVEALGDPGKAFFAAEALLVIGLKARPAIPELKRLLEDERPAVRRVAAEALRSILVGLLNTGREAVCRTTAQEIAWIRATGVRASWLRVMTYNILASRDRADQRVPSLLQILKSGSADVIALQEVSPWFMKRLFREEWMRDYRSAPAGDSGAASGGLLILSKLPIEGYAFHKLESMQGRGVLVARLKTGNRVLAVATVHLESPLKAGKMRAVQLKAVLPFLAAADDAVLLGDFNFGDGEEPETSTLPGDFADLWSTLCPGRPGYTWNIEKSIMARRASFPGERSRRLDRILLRSDYWRPRAVRIIGTQPVRKGRDDLFPSDHFGVLGVFTRKHF